MEERTTKRAGKSSGDYDEEIEVHQNHDKMKRYINLSPQAETEKLNGARRQLEHAREQVSIGWISITVYFNFVNQPFRIISRPKDPRTLSITAFLPENTGLVLIW